MTKQTLFALSYVLAGMAWGFAFYTSATKTTDVWFLPLGLMIMFHGLEKLLEGYNSAEAKVFGKLANACFIFVMAGGVWWVLRQV
jgi:hypothetical protein